MPHNVCASASIGQSHGDCLAQSAKRWLTSTAQNAPPPEANHSRLATLRPLGDPAPFGTHPSAARRPLARSRTRIGYRPPTGLCDSSLRGAHPGMRPLYAWALTLANSASLCTASTSVRAIRSTAARHCWQKEGGKRGEYEAEAHEEG